MKKFMTVLISTLMVMLTFNTISFASTVEPKEFSNVEMKSMQQIKANLENPNREVEKIVDAVLKGTDLEKEGEYTISEEQTLRKKLDSLDLASKAYRNAATEIIRNTDPKVLLKYVEKECERAVSALDGLENQKADYIYNSEDENGNKESMEVYDLGDGTEIVIQGIDEEDKSRVAKGNAFFSPCEIVTKTWITNNSMDKEKGDRRYTAIYNIKVAGTVRGKITVSNHYTVNKADLTMRAAEVWEYSGTGPLTIEQDGAAWKSSTTKVTKAGGEIYAGARFKVTSSNSITTTVEGTVGVGGTGISGGTSVTWNDNQTRLHKIYAAVDLNKFTTTGANVKNWGKVTFAK